MNWIAKLIKVWIQKYWTEAPRTSLQGLWFCHSAWNWWSWNAVGDSSTNISLQVEFLSYCIPPGSTRRFYLASPSQLGRVQQAPLARKSLQTQPSSHDPKHSLDQERSTRTFPQYKLDLGRDCSREPSKTLRSLSGGYKCTSGLLWSSVCIGRSRCDIQPFQCILRLPCMLDQRDINTASGLRRKLEISHADICRIRRCRKSRCNNRCLHGKHSNSLPHSDQAD